MIPSWILDTFAAIMLVVAAVSAGRLVAARRWQRGARPAALADIDVAHLLMAIAMAGMLAPGLRTLPGGAWEVVFAAMTAWFAYRVVRDARVSGFRALAGGHCAPHLIHAGAMLYMFVAVSAPMTHGSGGMSGGGMSGMGTLSLPFLAFCLALALVGYSIWDLDQLSGPGAGGHYSLAAARVAPAGPVPAGIGMTAGLGAAAMSGLATAPVTAEPVARPAQAAPVTPASGPADGTGVLAPWVATSCRIAMGVTMAFMLVLMI
jgi:Domain of unknown function (DUF5134)